MYRRGCSKRGAQQPSRVKKIYITEHTIIRLTRCPMRELVYLLCFTTNQAESSPCLARTGVFSDLYSSRGTYENVTSECARHLTTDSITEFAPLRQST